MGLLSFLEIESVTMPPRADEATLECGVATVHCLILENRQREAGCVDFDTDLSSGDVRWSCGTVSHPERQRLIGDDNGLTFKPRKKRPPNLHAPVLSFSARLLTLVNARCGGRGPVAYKRAGVSRQVYSRIVSDDSSSVDKETALQFCIGLQLDMPDAELLLKAAGYAFSGTQEIDRAFAWCIENRVWNIQDVDAILRRNDLRGLTLNF
mgnify:CR=1 FL=1